MGGRGSMGSEGKGTVDKIRILKAIKSFLVVMVVMGGLHVIMG